MGMTERITVPAVEETADVTALLMRLCGAWESATSDGEVTDAEMAMLNDYLRRLRDEQRGAAEAITDCDLHVQMIQGWTRVNGPNEKVVREAKSAGWDVDETIEKDRDQREAA